jgi:hypothetical protein
MDHNTVSLHLFTHAMFFYGNIKLQNGIRLNFYFIFIDSTSSALPVCQKSASEQTLRILTTYLSQVIIGYLFIFLHFFGICVTRNWFDTLTICVTQ